MERYLGMEYLVICARCERRFSIRCACPLLPCAPALMSELRVSEFRPECKLLNQKCIHELAVSPSSLAMDVGVDRQSMTAVPD